MDEHKPQDKTEMGQKGSKGWVRERRRARRLALIFLFARIYSDTPLEEVEHLLGEMARSWRDLPEFARQLCAVCEGHRTELEADIASVLENWRLDRIGFVERVILLLGASELSYFPDIPPRVTINEYVELAKRYCDANGPAFINGVLDRLAKLKGKPDF